jgi:hypothetical protein
MTTDSPVQGADPRQRPTERSVRSLRDFVTLPLDGDRLADSVAHREEDGSPAEF